MTRLNFTLESNDIQAIIDNSGANDLAKQMLTTLFNQLMEKQRDDYIQADAYVRGDERVSQRNGYYERSYTTRIGTIDLIVPRTRDGAFSPSIFERYQRNEKALVASMLEMYVQGVSTRKVSSIVETLCGESVSKSFISSLTKQLDEIVHDFLSQPITKRYPFLLSDVLFIKVREDRRVVSKAFHVVLGISDEGQRELLSFCIRDSESYESWKSIYTELKERGLTGVKLIISDSHQGEVKAIKECFTGISWQRCQVHFMRNVFDKLPRKNCEELRTELKLLFRITDIELARKKKIELLEAYQEDKYQVALNCLDEGFEDGFQYCATEETNYSRLKSTNMLERLNEEIRRREKVVRIFPNEASALRLLGCIIIDIHETWLSSGRQYIQYTESTKRWINE